MLHGNVQAVNMAQSAQSNTDFEQLMQTQSLISNNKQTAPINDLSSMNNLNNLQPIMRASQLNWPATGDFAEADDPTVKGGKIAYVKNAQQFLHAMYTTVDRTAAGYAFLGNTRNGGYSDITKIVLVNNIDIVHGGPKEKPQDKFVGLDNLSSFWNTKLDSYATYSGSDPDYMNLNIMRPTTDNTLTIDGQGIYNINSGNFCISLNRHLHMGGWDKVITIGNGPKIEDSVNKNVKTSLIIKDVTLYGTTIYGFVQGYQANADITYHNVKYYGSQMIYNRNDSVNNIYIEGTDNVCYSLAHFYYPGDNHIYNCQNNNQQNMEVSQINFRPGSRYYGYTFNGHVLDLYGKATLEKGAQVHLYPHGLSPENRNGASSPSKGINLLSDTADLIMDKDSLLDIDVNTQPLSQSANITDDIVVPADDATQAKTPASALYINKGNIDYKKDSGARIQITSEGKFNNTNGLVQFGGGLAKVSDGEFTIKANELGDYSGPIMNITNSAAQILVDQDGVFELTAPKATGTVDLVRGTNFVVNAYKPKRMYLRSPNDKSYLVGGSGDIILRNIKASASKDYNFGNELKDASFQYLKMHFNNRYLTKDGVQVQTTPASLAKLKGVMSQMMHGNNIDEFSEIIVNSIGEGTKLTKVTPEITPKERKITGQISEKDPNISLQKGSRLRLLLNRSDGTQIDLGTTYHQGSSSQLVPDIDLTKDSFDPGSKMFTAPDLSWILPDAYDIDNQELEAKMEAGEMSQTATKDKIPLYYVTDNQYLKLDDATGEFTIDNIDKLIANYNSSHPGANLELLPDDELQINAVRNFQSSNLVKIPVNSLYINLNDKVTNNNYYAIGEDLQIPAIYQDLNKDANKITLHGYLDQSDDAQIATTAAAPYNGDVAITNHDKQDNDINWKIAGQDNKGVIDDITKTAGEHNLRFWGEDDQGNRSPYLTPDKNGNILAKSLRQYNYEVLDVPGYKARKAITYRNGDTSRELAATDKSDNPEKLTTNRYLEKNEFQPLTSDIPLTNFTITRAAGDTTNTVKLGKYTLYIKDNAGKILAQKSNFKFDYKYTPADFGHTFLNGFPKGITLEVDGNLEIKKDPKDKTNGVVLAPLKLTSSVTNHNGNELDHPLAQTKALKFANPSYLLLTVPDTIDYGHHILNNSTDKIFDIQNDKNVWQATTLTYDHRTNSNFNVGVSFSGFYLNNIGPLNNLNLLYYDKPNTKSPTILTNKTTTINTIKSSPTDNLKTKHILDNWWDSKQNQKSSLFLQTKAQPNKTGHYAGKMTWSATNSLD